MKGEPWTVEFRALAMLASIVAATSARPALLDLIAFFERTDMGESDATLATAHDVPVAEVLAAKRLVVEALTKSTIALGRIAATQDPGGGPH